jgi:hypothetical protein
MTELDWLDCTDPAAMLDSLRGQVSERKLRLFAVACCRRSGAQIRNWRVREGVEVAERLADGEVAPEELWATVALVREGKKATAWSPPQEYAARAVLFALSEGPVPWVEGPAGWAVEALRCATDSAVSANPAGREAEQRGQADLLRDLFGNPFHPLTVPPPWRTPDVTALAVGIYADRAFDRLPILADALEEAGCSDSAILRHARGPGPHGRGCWLVDLLLDKA